MDVAVVVAAGCTAPNPNRCCTDEADCAAKNIPTVNLCSEGLVCRGMNPLFVNAAAGDFHLMTGSPAIDAADPASTEPADHEGTPRPQGAGRDIGAFERKP